MARLVLVLVVALAGPFGFIALLPCLEKDARVLAVIGVLMPSVVVFRILLRSAIADERKRKVLRSFLMVAVSGLAVLPLVRGTPEVDAAVFIVLSSFCFYHVMAAVRRMLDAARRRRLVTRPAAIGGQIAAGVPLLVPLFLCVAFRRFRESLDFRLVLVGGFAGAWFLGKGGRDLITLWLTRRGRSWSTDLTFALWLTATGAITLVRAAWIREAESWEVRGGTFALVAGLGGLVAWARKSRVAPSGPGPGPGPAP